MILRLRTRCLYLCAGDAVGREAIIIASYTRGQFPTAWYKAILNTGEIVTGPPSSFLVIDPIPATYKE